jgi:hypothetical protein
MSISRATITRRTRRQAQAVGPLSKANTLNVSKTTVSNTGRSATPINSPEPSSKTCRNSQPSRLLSCYPRSLSRCPTRASATCLKAATSSWRDCMRACRGRAAGGRRSSVRRSTGSAASARRVLQWNMRGRMPTSTMHCCLLSRKRPRRCGATSRRWQAPCSRALTRPTMKYASQR